MERKKNVYSLVNRYTRTEMVSVRDQPADNFRKPVLILVAGYHIISPKPHYYHEKVLLARKRIRFLV